MISRAILVLVVLAAGVVARADELYVRVVDVGAGMCCVVVIPGETGNRYMVYDAGNFADSGATARAAIGQLIPEGSAIDLLVLSHSDGDHVAAVPWICQHYEVKKAILPRLERNRVNWKNAVKALGDEPGCDDMGPEALNRGHTFTLGDAAATFVCGFSEPPADWEITSEGERMNAGSIVMRLTYMGKSVLFTGDAVGRHLDDPADACIDAEKLMVDGAGSVPIDSDVLVAPHHGADNGSSTAFIQAVTPRWVVFSAGHDYDHPRAATAQRYLSCGVSAGRMYRTDRGDDESADGDREWKRGRKSGMKDPKGDDDVEIRIKDNGKVSVKYRPH
jgi:beta-lactamase superfamily II metal-dependent hydrolase